MMKPYNTHDALSDFFRNTNDMIMVFAQTPEALETYLQNNLDHIQTDGCVVAGLVTSGVSDEQVIATNALIAAKGFINGVRTLSPDGLTFLEDHFHGSPLRDFVTNDAGDEWIQPLDAHDNTEHYSSSLHHTFATAWNLSSPQRRGKVSLRS